VLDLCRAGKAATTNAPTEEREEMYEAVTKSCRASQALLHAMKESRNVGVDEAGNKLLIQSSAKAVALAVSEIVGASANLIPAGYIDMSDPNVVAERELLQAASMIEMAAKSWRRLNRLRNPGRRSRIWDSRDRFLRLPVLLPPPPLLSSGILSSSYIQIRDDSST
jgi:hypothetical protein